jgi:Asp-tRNA(Asn)/Glu-tRNA(Gln) amidotransferase A subunit family amidase
VEPKFLGYCDICSNSVWTMLAPRQRSVRAPPATLSRAGPNRLSRAPFPPICFEKQRLEELSAGTMAASAVDPLAIGAAEVVDALREGRLERHLYVDALLKRHEETRFGFALTPGFTPQGARARAGLAEPEPTLEDRLKATAAKDAQDDGAEPEDDDDPEARAARLAKQQAAAARKAEQEAARAERERENGDPKPDASGPLSGVPILVSDTIDVRGLATTAGNSALSQWRAERSAAVVRKLVGAGGFVLGKSTVHDLAQGFTCVRTPKGQVANPYSSGACIAGGSAGGAAAAVAARVAPLALAIDSLGDARVPGHCCGVAVFRPSLGRYPLAGALCASSTLDTVAVMSRSVEDIQLADSILCAIATEEGGGEPEGEEEAAAIVVQAGARGFLARQRIRKQRSGASPRDDRAEAATKIQSIARGRAARKRVAEIRAGTQEEATMSFHEAEEAAATRIQATMRGKLARSKVAQLRSDARSSREHDAAVRIQAMERARAAHRKVEGLRMEAAKEGMAVSPVVSPRGASGLVTDLKGLRIGLALKPFAEGCDSTVMAVVHEVAAKLRAAGAEVIEAEVPTVEDVGGKPGVGERVPVTKRALAAVESIRSFEALRELGLYLASRGLDCERQVAVELPSRPPSDEDDEEVVPPGPRISLVKVRTTVSDVVAAFAGSTTERQALTRALDLKGSVADGGSAVDPATYAEAITTGRASVLRAMEGFILRNKLDAIMYPTALVPAVAEKGRDGDAVYCERALVPAREALTRNAAVASVAGMPAITIPGGLTPKRGTAGVGQPGGERLPVGVEFASLPGTDERILAIARAVQALIPPLPDPVLRQKWQRGVNT